MPSLNETVALAVNGRVYSTWTEIMLRRTYGGICSDFEFTAAEPLDSSTDSIDYTDWRITPGDRCTITLAGILAFTGYVFTRNGSFNAKNHGLRIVGRSLTADAVDSSMPLDGGGQYNGYTFEGIASALANYAGVKLIIKGSSPALATPFPRFSVAVGETIFMALERLARMRGLHLTDDANGNLIADVFNPAAAPVGLLVEGQNLVEARALIDGSSSFNIINICAQRPGNDQINGTAARDNSATVTNPNVRSTRQLTVVAEEPGSPQDCVTRANHETAYGSADIVECHCVVQGWQSSPGVLWDVYQQYSVQSKMLDLDRVLVSREVIYRQSDAGSRTEIDLRTPESIAFPVANIGPTAQPGEPAYRADTPPRGATPNPPDNF